MRVLIINPPWPSEGYGTRSQNRIIKQRGDKFLQYPLFLGYSAAQLKHAGHEVFFLDSVMDDIPPTETWDRVERLRPDAIFMETTTPSIDYDLQDIAEMKRRTGAVTLAGGPHVTFFPEQTLVNCPELDIVVRNEYDVKLAPVLAHLDDLHQIEGVTFRDNGHITSTEQGEWFTDLDSLPFPDRDTVPYFKYSEAWYSRKPFINMTTSRGCPYRCTFCLWPGTMEGRKHRYRSLENVMDEIRYTIDRYGVREINFDDSTFTTRKSRVIEFCQQLRDNKFDILWVCNGRVDNVDDEMLREMKASGCKMIRYGVESGDPEVLKKIKKGYTLEQVREAFKLTRKHGIMIQAGFMFGFPYDTRESVEATLQLSKELTPDQVQFSIAMAYPGTPLYDEAVENDWLIAKSWAEYGMIAGPILKTQDMTREELAPILSRAYREFHFRPRYFLRTLGNIKDIYEFRRVMRSAKSMLSTMLWHGKSKKGQAC